MMISNAQMTALDTRVLDQFSRDISIRLAEEFPEWAGNGTPGTRDAQVIGMVRYGRELRLTDPEDLYRFTAAMIRFGPGIPLAQPLAAEFRTPGISRAAQVENFMLRLMSNRDRLAAVSL